MKFRIGDRVAKVGGSYIARGTIVAIFSTLTGAERVVFEFDVLPGMLHIFSPEQLVLADD